MHNIESNEGFYEISKGWDSELSLIETKFTFKELNNDFLTRIHGSKSDFPSEKKDFFILDNCIEKLEESAKIKLYNILIKEKTTSIAEKLFL
jgi:hypothetical protein